MSPIDRSDEYAHSPDETADWRESYYFNWVDLKMGVSGFSTIGLLPNSAKSEFVFALFYEDKREFYFKDPSGPVPTDFEESLSDGVLSYEIVEPFKEWQLNYEGAALKVKIKWLGRFPPYDFGVGSGTSWAGHFEQSGIPEGVIEFSDGREVKFKGYGERDKSWGLRNWHIESWYALHAQFDELSVGLRLDTVKGENHPSGGISTAAGHSPIAKIDLQTLHDKNHPSMPSGAITRVRGNDGSVYTIRSHLISPTSFVRFQRAFPGGKTELFEEMAVHECDELGETGTGLIEWLFTHRVD